MSAPLKNSRAKTMPGVRKGWLLVAVVIIGGAFFGLGARAIVATGQGADFESVFNEPARTADGAAEIAWTAGEPLLRELEPQTRIGVEFAWTRALAAVGDSADGDTTGVDVWFSGPAQDHVHELVAVGAILDGGSWVSHDITPNFYSIDGQILVTEIIRTSAAPDGLDDPFVDRVRAVFILRDGNWRVEHLTVLEAILR